MEKALGSRAKEMMLLRHLATDPSCQGRGYGGALVDYMNTLADEEDLAMSLLWSNIANNDFYYSHGFIAIADFSLGDNNPTWEKEPVVLTLVGICLHVFRFVLLVL
jgi:N-acetylglutamate synthase-like GNAT family acetyltransferase